MSGEERYSTALHIAIEEGLYEMALKIIEKGEDIHAKDDFGLTPLHRATMRRNTKIVKKLIKVHSD